MKQKTRIMIYILIAIAVVIIGTIAILSSRTAKPVSESHLDLGRIYLADLSYDKAILEFKEAIKIDPKDPEPYIELANAYIEIGDIPSAIETLEAGMKETDDDEIEDMLEELKKSSEEIQDNESEFDVTSVPSETSVPIEAASEEETTASTANLVEVPDLNGLSEEEAKKLCEDNGFKYSVSYVGSNDIEKGFVIGQTIPAGTSVAEGISIPFSVSEGSAIKVELIAENLEFDYLADFEESGWAFAVRGSKGGYVNTSGKFVDVYNVNKPSEDDKYRYYDDGVLYELLYMINGRPYFEDTDECCPSYEFYINEFKVSYEGLYPYYQNSKWGYANINTGNIVIPCKYNSVSFFNCGRGIVSYDDPQHDSNTTYIPQRYMILTADNKEITVNAVSHFQDVSEARVSSKYCYVNNVLLCYLSLVFDGNGSTINALIDINGNIIDTEISVVPSDSRNSDFIHEGVLYSTYKNGEVKRVLLDDNLNKIMPFEGDNYGITLMSYYGEYIFWVQKEDPYDWTNQNKTFGIIDKNGNILCSNKPWSSFYYFNGCDVTFASDGYCWYLINKYGNKINDEYYDETSNVVFNIAAVKKNGKWGVVNSDGKLLINYKYDEFAPCTYLTDNNVRLILAKQNGEWYLIDENENIIAKINGEFFKAEEKIIITKTFDCTYNFYNWNG